MWSDRYNYYNIQFDQKFSQKLDKTIVVSALLETNLLKQDNHQRFSNIDAFPWVDIMITETYDGNFSASENENDYITLIAIVCVKAENVDQQIYTNVFLQIAEKLFWKLYLEQDDEGNEDIEIKRY